VLLDFGQAHRVRGLENRLRKVQATRGRDQFITFYRHFLLRLFHDGLGSRVRTPELDELLGDVPYLDAIAGWG
jgi:hypothetical protein